MYVNKALCILSSVYIERPMWNSISGPDRVYSREIVVVGVSNIHDGSTGRGWVIPRAHGDEEREWKIFRSGRIRRK